MHTPTPVADTAVAVSDDLSLGWARVASFVAEFCALGGRVVSRTRVPGGAPLPAALAKSVPDVDGVALIVANAFLGVVAADIRA